MTDEHVGRRLDHYLTECLVEHTRSALRRLIEDGRVVVDGCPAAKSGLVLQAGMCISIRFPAPAENGPRPESIPLDVLYEDAHLLALNKQANLVVHPGHGRREGTIVNALLGRGTPLSATGAPDRPGIVHRLDLGTSGVLVVAKTDRAYRSLTASFAARSVAKHYVALVWGHPDPAAGTLDQAIGRSRANPMRMAVKRGGREARTRYTTREAMTGFALLDVYPETGRTHQIRVHLQSIHHPIVGDTRYAGRAWRGVQHLPARNALAAFDRLALHAASIEFDHPETGQRLTIAAPLPEDFGQLLEILRRW